MLYLEDYLEMIEHLPSELQDRFTDMREMDLSVQNRMDSLEKRQKQFFLNCVQNKKFKGAEREEEYERIRKEYAKVIEDAGEKVNLAEDSYGLVDKYLRRLDDELLKFKLELEADNRGITEILEKRSLEMDQPSTTNSNYKENRHPKKSRKHNLTTVHSIPGGSGGSGVTVAHHIGPASGNRIEQRKSTSNLGQVYSSVTGDGLSLDTLQSLSPSSTGAPGAPTGNANTYPLQHMGAGGNAIAQAASQAIAATQQLTGRRTSSLKASFEAINLGLQTHEFSIGGELASAAQSALVASALSGPSTSSSMGSSPGEQSGAGSTKRKKMSKSTSAVAQNPVLDVGSIIDESLINPGFVGENSPTTEELLSGSRTGESGTPDQDWYDPSEPRYCICNQVSYGDMVACDNEDCLYEWFHYPCVGITAPPKGKWYCPTCTANMARRKGRKLTI